MARSTFHDFVNKGKIIPMKGIRGFYLLNASLSRLGLREEPLFAVDAAIEHTAQHIYSQIIARRGELSSLEIGQTEEFEEVDLNSLQLINSRTVGAEHVSLEAFIEEKIFGRVQDIFSFTPTITLYDLTNTPCARSIITARTVATGTSSSPSSPIRQFR